MASSNPSNEESSSDKLRAYLVGLDCSIIKKAYGDSYSDEKPEIKILRIEYEDLICRFESELFMHKLSAGYYHNRAFWFTFLPLLIVTTSVSICGFIDTGIYDDSMVFDGNENQPTAMSDTTTNDADVTNSQGTTLSLIIGLLGVLSTFLAALGKHLNYESKGDMHSSAASTLNSMLENILFDYTEFKVKTRLLRVKETSLDDKVIEDLRVDLQSHKSKFEIMDQSCSAPIPDTILQAFVTLRGIRDCIKHPRVRFKIYRRFANDLFRKFQRKGCFYPCPCYPPHYDVEDMFETEFKCEVKKELARCKEETMGTPIHLDDSTKPDKSKFQEDPETVPISDTAKETKPDKSESEEKTNENTDLEQGQRQ